jgi:hypothetical protein
MIYRCVGRNLQYSKGEELDNVEAINMARTKKLRSHHIYSSSDNFTRVYPFVVRKCYWRGCQEILKSAIAMGQNNCMHAFLGR